MKQSDKILVIDYGEKKMGLALIHQELAIATPLKVIKNIQTKSRWYAMDTVMSDWFPQYLVLGLPLQLDGSDNRITPKVRLYRDQLIKRYKLEVHWIDERLTSYEARQRNINRKKYPLDSLAALVMAELWLQQQNM